MKFAVAAAVNDHATLGLCLAASPDLQAQAIPLAIFEGYRSAGLAYNAAIAANTADYLILAHQDVYLPRGFFAELEQQLARASQLHPDWAVAGIIGLEPSGALVGQTWCSANDALLGNPCPDPARVVTFDELLIIVRKDRPVPFDPALPGFHLYGADIILNAQAAGYGALVVQAPVVHFSKRVIELSGDYARSWHYMQHKWSDLLPIPNLVCPITKSGWTLFVANARLRWQTRFARDRPEPVGIPAQIAQRLGLETAA